MKKLFRLRDLYARRNAFDASEDERAIGQMEGMLCTLQAEKLQADADRGRANANWAVAREELTAVQKSLDALTKAHQDLLVVHQSIADENTALKKEVQSRKEITNALTKANEELLVRHQSIMQENTALKKQSACELLVPVRNALMTVVLAAFWQCPDLPASQWLAMTKPTPRDPHQLLACWLQFQEHITIPGIPFRDDNFTLDLRDLRGHAEVMARLPQSTRNPSRALRRQCFLGITKLLAVPGRYEELIRMGNHPIAASVRYLPLFSDSQENITEGKVAQQLASQGLTLRVADDAWQYCYNVVLSEPNAASNNEAVALRAHIEAKLERLARPAGINPPAQDIFPRPRNLPSKRR